MGALLASALVVEGVWLGLYRVPSGSMIPALWPGDLVVAHQWAYGVRLPLFGAVGSVASPARGDVVVARSPALPGTLWVKRVVAVAGEVVTVRRGLVRVDGEVPGEDPTTQSMGLGEHRPSRCQASPARRLGVREAGLDLEVWLDPGAGNLQRDFGPYRVPPGHVFLMGDNRDHSLDSRRFGPVRFEDVVGRVSRVLWSLDDCTGAWRTDRAFLEVPAGPRVP